MGDLHCKWGREEVVGICTGTHPPHMSNINGGDESRKPRRTPELQHPYAWTSRSDTWPENWCTWNKHSIQPRKQHVPASLITCDANVCYCQKNRYKLKAVTINILSDVKNIKPLLLLQNASLTEMDDTTKTLDDIKYLLLKQHLVTVTSNVFSCVFSALIFTTNIFFKDILCNTQYIPLRCLLIDSLSFA